MYTVILASSAPSNISEALEEYVTEVAENNIDYINALLVNTSTIEFWGQ